MTSPHRSFNAAPDCCQLFDCEGCQAEVLEPAALTRVVKKAYSISYPVLGDDGQLLRPEDEDFLEFYVVLVRDAEKRPPALTPRLRNAKCS